MTVTKAVLREMLFGQLGLNKREAGDFVEAFFTHLHASLARGDAVKLSGFGSFTLRDKRPRPGRNPRTGESAPVSARRVVTFKASGKLKQRVMQNSFALTQKLGRGRRAAS